MHLATEGPIEEITALLVKMRDDLLKEKENI